MNASKATRAPVPALAILLLIALLLLLAVGAGWLLENVVSFEGPPRVQEIAVADLNGDGALDAYLTINPDGEPYLHPDIVLFNDGQGRFVDSGQRVGNTNSFSAAAGDLDGDGDIDVVAGRLSYFNDGSGHFGGSRSPVGAAIAGTFSWATALGDLDGDGDLDAFGGACCGGGIPGPTPTPLFSRDEVWLNVGYGRLQTAAQLAPSGSNDVALGDLDGDGDLDAFVAAGLSTLAGGETRRDTPDSVWFNDGRGRFTQSQQRLGRAESLSVALGDVDGDGDLDALVGNVGRDVLWLNDGDGIFTRSAQRLSDGASHFIFVRDLNGDGSPDIFIGGETVGRLWLNRGDGRFRLTPRRFRYDDDAAPALGDFTGDGLPDLLAAGPHVYWLWRGAGEGRFTAAERVEFRPHGDE